jgi:hypothetical protein
MILPPLEPAYRDESNGSGFILLRPLDAELFDKISRSRHFTFCAMVLRHLTFCLISRHPVVVEEWSYRHWNQLIETNPMIVVSSFYDNWMPRYLTKHRHFAFCDTAPFDVLPNISASSGRRRMKPPSLDSSRYAGSNGGKIILLRSLDAKLFRKWDFNNFNILKLLNFGKCFIWKW